MAARVIPKNEERGWLAENLDLEVNYRRTPKRNKHNEGKSSNHPRVITYEEEMQLRTRISPSTLRANNSHRSMTPVELLLSQKNMEREFELELERQKERKREEARKRVQILLRKQKIKKYIQDLLKASSVKEIITKVAKKAKNAKDKLDDIINPQPKLEELGVSPPHSRSNGGYNYQKYKYTNIAKKQAKPKIMAKKPAKRKIMAKKPAKPKI